MDVKYKKNVLLVTKESKSFSNKANIQCLAMVEEHLKKLNFSYTIVSRYELNKDLFKDRLIISIGGDGTLLSAAFYCKENPIFGINSEPEISVGALCVANRHDFINIFEDLKDNKTIITPLSRMDISIENNPNIKAFNDILFCHNNPATVSHYEVNLANKNAEHKSSGLWVSTAMGSSGAIFSAGGFLQEFDDDSLQFLVREPYKITGDYVSTLRGIFKKSQILKLKCKMNEAMIYVDGPHNYYSVPYSSSISIQVSNEPLLMVNGYLLKSKRNLLVETRMKYREICQKKMEVK